MTCRKIDCREVASREDANNRKLDHPRLGMRPNSHCTVASQSSCQMTTARLGGFSRGVEGAKNAARRLLV